MWSVEQEGLELQRPCWVSTSLEEEKEKESSTKGKEKESFQSGGLNSEALSTASRAIFQVLENERREKEKGAVVDKWDMCRINGAVDYDGDGVMSWVYECVLLCVLLFPSHASSNPHCFLSYWIGPLVRPISATNKTRNIVAQSLFPRCGRTSGITRI